MERYQRGIESMSNILVTGANGFVGSHLVNRLKKDNKVVSLIHSYLPGKWFDEAISGSIIVDCDVR
ncbi:MAG: NAD-dependent epimerase/dehydratase family protein, partial [Candidatus Thorarchaeota archaeon]